MKKSDAKGRDPSDGNEESNLIQSPGNRRNAIKEEVEGAQSDLQTKVKEKKEEIVQKRTKEELKEYKDIRNFYEGIFGKTIISSFLISITSWIAGEDGKFDPKEFKEEIDRKAKKAAEKEFDIEEYVVSHRALGYGRHKANTPEALRAAVNSGEKQIEMDIREGKDGNLYVEHDFMKNEESPERKHMSIEQALNIIAACRKNPEVVVFFDVKEPGIMKKLDAAISKVDWVNKKKYKKEYQPISERHFINTSDERILKAAQESNPTRPLIFYYFPACKLSVIGHVLKMIGKNKMKSILEGIDSLSGSSFAQELERKNLKYNGRNLGFGDGPEESTSFHIWENLPGEEILQTIKKSKGYICIPAALATKDLVADAKAEGVKVAVWGANDERVKEMIYELEVDLVISDTPDVIKDEPVEYAAAA